MQDKFHDKNTNNFINGGSRFSLVIDKLVASIASYYGKNE